MYFLNIDRLKKELGPTGPSSWTLKEGGFRPLLNLI